MQLKNQRTDILGTDRYSRCNVGKSGKSASLMTLPFCLFAFVKIDFFIKD